ncbi:MAG: hypothetical protein CMK09_09335 [Ponticaulis sp.]|nr:hypothetical protein [Ponticaulis sp.]|tara:strand:- start:32859 stop:33110 length:252 start_codon:yes stop_codon:yes gene_type:complete
MILVLWIFAAMLGFAVWYWFTAEKQYRRKIAEEIDHARLAMDSDLYRELQELLKDDRKPEAIKRLREETGVGQVAARSVVDAL